MAVMVIQEFAVEETDCSTNNYDAVGARLNAKQDPPDGLIVHTAGFTGRGSFRIAEVWESVGDWEAFRDGRLADAVQPVMEADPEAGPPDVYSYELHDVIRT